mmetsp:Transcript_100339/g.323826  ORF Transcript_100339/g.323826 Transcript_100339/m.323826 type:complete len:548 (+) Transcript_100339:106-1749(+)
MPADEKACGDEAKQVFLDAGFDKELLVEDEAFVGQGGPGSVATVAAFTSLAGLLFGLGLGYIAPMKSMDSFQQDVLGGERIADWQDSVITMTFGLGAAVTAFPPVIRLAGDRFGRKGCLVLGGIVFCVGTLLQGTASDLRTVMAGRLPVGMSIGLLTANAPVYQSEIAPPSLRGMFVSTYQLAVTVGIMLAFLLGLLFEGVHEPLGGWRWLVLVQLIPGLALVLGGAAMGESPRWLVSKGMHQEALVSLRAVRGPDEDVRNELADICREHLLEEVSGRPGWAEFLSGRSLKLLAIGVALQLLQQLCGMNAYMYDGPTIFGKVFHSSNAGLLFTVVSGVVNILSTFPAIFLIDRAGRTSLLRASALGMALCSAALAGVGAACFPPRHAEECAGGCANATASGAGGEDGAPAGVCGSWAKWAATASICLFIFNFGYGWGPVVWTYCAEMFPLKYRTQAVGATTCANWVGNVFIAMLPPILLHEVGFHTFWVFVGVNILGFYMASILPETKDKSLEDIQRTFEEWLDGSEDLSELSSGKSSSGDESCEAE